MNNYQMKIASSPLILVLLCRMAFCADLPTARLTVEVKDEDGRPLGGARAELGFLVGKGNALLGGEPIAVAGATDAHGRFSSEHVTGINVGYGATLEGYYLSGYEYQFRSKPEGNHWEPWNPTVEVVLKRVVNPIPMYARKVTLHFPAENVPLGYDLLDSDWTVPYGKGHVADFVFTVRRVVRGQDDFDSSAQLAFTNRGDGIQTVNYDPRYGSELRLPRTAPEEGYASQWPMSFNRKAGERLLASRLDGRSFFFRVRTQLDEKGRVVSTLYGKILGEFAFGGVLANQASVSFTYYVNPNANDRNMEFDPKRNLFGELKFVEQVNAP